MGGSLEKYGISSLWAAKIRAVVIVLPIFLLVLLASSAISDSGQGYVDTASWWQDIRGKTTQYRLLLQNLYAEVEVSQRNDRSKTNAEFARRLARDYPGSNYFAGSHGTLAVNNYTTIHFDNSWNINNLRQKFGSLEKAYDFRAQTFTVSDGPNRVVFRVDLGRPEKSHFTIALIPAISVNAEQVWARRKPASTSNAPLKDLLNDAYVHRLAGGGIRMDKLAEELVTDPSARESLLQIAGELYAINSPGQAAKGVASPSPSKPSAPAVNIPPPSTLVSAIFKLVPWYAYLLLFLVLALRIAMPTRRSSKKALLEYFFQYLMSRKNSQPQTSRQSSRQDSWEGGEEKGWREAIYTEEENWLGERNGRPQNHVEKPSEWTPQVLGSLEWKRFETVCAEYFRIIGYEPRETRIGADGGVDIWVYKTGSQKPTGIVQCKAWSNKVGVKPVRELFGVMAAEGIANGKFMTAGEFTSEALQFAEGKKLQLISGEEFLAAIKKLPAAKQAELLSLATEGDFRTPTCPQCGKKMKLRKVEGAGARPFWGCSQYPRCKAKLVYKVKGETGGQPQAAGHDDSAAKGAR
jgi:restriction system protein